MPLGTVIGRNGCAFQVSALRQYHGYCILPTRTNLRGNTVPDFLDLLPTTSRLAYDESPLRVLPGPWPTTAKLGQARCR